MSADRNKIQLLCDLLDSQRDGEVSEENIRKINELLHDDLALQRFYIRYTAVWAHLRFQMADYSVLRSASQVDPAAAIMADAILEDKSEDQIEADRMELILQQVQLSQDAARRRSEEEAASQAKLEAESKARMESMRRLAGLSKHESNPRTKHYVIPKPLFYGSIAAIVAITVMILWPQKATVVDPVDPIDVVVEPQSETVLAILATSVRSNWGDAQTFAVGDELFEGRYDLEDGLVELQYASGARVIVEAPASFTLDSNEAITLHRGRIVGTCPTLESRGFVVQMPNAKIRDLGTEFGALVAESGIAESHVFSGKVELISTSNGFASSSPVELSEGEACRVTRTGTGIETIAVSEIDFVRDAELRVNVKAEKGSAYHRWLAYQYEVRRHPALIARYTFEAADEAANVLSNTAPRTSGRLHGRLNSSAGESPGPRWTTGRFGRDHLQKRALQFNGEKQEQVVVDHDDVLNFTNGVTIALWVRLFDDKRTHHFMTKRVYTPRNREAINFAWVGEEYLLDSTQRPNSILFHTHTIDGRDLLWKDFETSEISSIPPGWRHIAVTFDGTWRRFYLNGRMIHVIEDARRIEHVGTDLIIGGVGPSDLKSLDGVLDEVLIFDGALGESEIQRMYESGKPD